MKHKHTPLLPVLCALLAAQFPPLFHCHADTPVTDLESILNAHTSPPRKSEKKEPRFPETSETFSMCIALTKKLATDPILQEKAQVQLLRALLDRGEIETAIWFAESVTGTGAANALAILSNHFASNQRPADAKKYLERARSLANAQLGWKRDRALIEIASTCQKLGLTDEASDVASKISEEVNRIRVKARIAEVKARHTGEPSFEIIRPENVPEKYLLKAAAQSRPFEAAADFWIEKKDNGKAKSLLIEAAAVAACANNNTQISPTIRIAGKLAALGFAKEAGEVLDSAISTANRIGDNAYWKTSVFARLSTALHKSGDTEQAAKMLETAAAFPAMLPLMDQPQAYVSLAEGWLSLGHPGKARVWWRKALDTAASNPNKRMRAHGAFLVSLSHAASGIPFPDGMRTQINTFD